MILEYTGYSMEEIMDCAAVIARKIGEEPVTASRRQLVAVKRKFDNRKYQYVSNPSIQLPSVKFIPYQLEYSDTSRE